ncbi:MAG: ABC transporter permease [Christensenellales bacterium]
MNSLIKKLNMKKNMKIALIICLVIGLIFTALTLYALFNESRVKDLNSQTAAYERTAAKSKAEELLAAARNFYNTTEGQTSGSTDTGTAEKVELTSLDKITIWLYDNIRYTLVLAINFLLAAAFIIFFAIRKNKRRKESAELKKVVSSNSVLGILIAFCILFFDLAILSASFMQTNNFLNVLQQINVNFIMSIGMAFVIISGGIDLSVGTNVGLSAYFMGIMMNYWHIGILPSVIAGIALATLFGAINGFTITAFKLPPFIGTLGMMYIGRGIVYTIASGNTIHNFPDDFRAIAGRVAGIPLYAIIIMIVVFAVAWYVLRYTRFGRYVFAIGGNETCAKLSGIDVNKVKRLVYTVSGLCCGIAAVLLTSRLDSTVAMTGEGYEMDAIAAVVIGGTSMKGGEGSLFGTVIGILIIGFISNGLNLLGVAQGPQKMVKGIIILIAVIIDVYRRQSAESTK